MLISRVEWRIERNYQRCKKPEAIPRVRSFEIGNGAGISYDDGLFRLACRADSPLQKPIQLSVTPRIANCRVSERPLLSPQICGSVAPHRRRSTVVGDDGGILCTIRLLARPFPYRAGECDFSNGLPQNSSQIVGSSSTNRIAVYEPRWPRFSPFPPLVKSTRGRFRRLYHR